MCYDFLLHCRGESFREALLHVGELRSLVTPSVRVLAMTATISRPSREYIQTLLGMHSPKVFTMSPCKDNIKYSLCSCDSLEEAFSPLLKELKELRTALPRTVVFCRTMNHCSAVYFFFKDGMKHGFLEPVDAPDLSRYRLVDMFHRHTDPDVKSNIVQLFTSDSQLRIVICTTAFGMGIDCQNVRQVFHFGPPDDTSSYVQQTGRCG